MSLGIDSFNVSHLTLCPSCIEGKQHGVTFRKENSISAQEILELIHSDICGPLQTLTSIGYICFLTFIADKSR